jgi:hypothetical protein
MTDAQEQKPALDLGPLALPVKSRADMPLLMVYGLCLLAAEWATVSGVRYSYWQSIGFAGPVVLFVIALWISLARTRRFESDYIAELLERAHLPNSDENRALAKAALQKRQPMGDVTGFSIVAAIVLIEISFSQIYWSAVDFSFHDIGSALGSVVNIFVYFFVLFLGLILGVGPAALVSAEIVRDPSDGARATLSLKEEQRNDVELVSINVALQSVQRRVETFTIESTLLSALSFSTFMAMVYSDRGPLESIQWLRAIPWRCLRDAQNVCVPFIGLVDISNHLMFVIASFLLACAVFFLAVLITRLRFNEAFRYTEEILRTAEAVNVQENASSDVLRPNLTQEISRLVDRAKHGLDDLGPMVAFMKLFRELGIFAFMGAVATCGMFFHWMVSASIIALFAAALFFGYIDKLRRKSSFLPRLQNTILNLK